MRPIAFAVSLVAAVWTIGLPQDVHADGFAKIVVSRTKPIGDTTYNGLAESSFVFGFRVAYLWAPSKRGVLSPWRFGVDGSVDWTIIQNDYGFESPFDEADVGRTRLLLGSRIARTVQQSGTTLFLRVGFGVDQTTASTRGIGAFPDRCIHESTAPAVETGAGIDVRVARAIVGGQVSYASAWHDERGGCGIPLVYTSREVSFVVSVGYAFR